MRGIAARANHPGVAYLGRRDEALPLHDDSVDAALLFGAWHHLADRAKSVLVQRPDLQCSQGIAV
jgi:hypothetical protein